MCSTVDTLHPFQSTLDLDGSLSDRETVQDIAYDGNTPIEEHRKNRRHYEPHSVVDLGVRSRH